MLSENSLDLEIALRKIYELSMAHGDLGYVLVPGWSASTAGSWYASRNRFTRKGVGTMSRDACSPSWLKARHGPLGEHIAS